MRYEEAVKVWFRGWLAERAHLPSHQQIPKVDDIDWDKDVILAVFFEEGYAYSEETIQDADCWVVARYTLNRGLHGTPGDTMISAVEDAEYFDLGEIMKAVIAAGFD